MSEPGDSFLVTQSARNRLAEHNADVLDRVMRVYLEVPFRLDTEVHHAVACHLIEHVLEKRDTGVEPCFAASIEVEAELDLSFLGVSFDCGFALLHGVWGPNPESGVAYRLSSRPLKRPSDFVETV